MDTFDLVVLSIVGIIFGLLLFFSKVARVIAYEALLHPCCDSRIYFDDEGRIKVNRRWKRRRRK